jgi:hypothetical protein
MLERFAVSGPTLLSRSALAAFAVNNSAELFKPPETTRSNHQRAFNAVVKLLTSTRKQEPSPRFRRKIKIAKALYNRGVAWGEKGGSDKELADYTRVIEELPGAPVEEIAAALVNRESIPNRRPCRSGVARCYG